MKRSYMVPWLLIAVGFLITGPAAYGKPQAEQGSNMQKEDAAAVLKRTDVVVMSKNELTELVGKAADTLQRFKNENIIPETAFNSAECVAVFPGVTQAALLVGGKHGDGVATCRGPENRWSRAAFLDLTGASFGAQVGVKSTDLVLLFRNENAQKKLSAGKVTLGADLSVAAGETGKQAEARSDQLDVVAYAESAGAYLGASLTGTVITADEEELQAYYEDTVLSHYTILSSYDTASAPEEVRELIMIIPRDAAG